MDGTPHVYYMYDVSSNVSLITSYLSQEFREKAAFLAQSKVPIDNTSTCNDAKTHDSSNSTSISIYGSRSGDDDSKSSSLALVCVDNNAKLAITDPESDSTNNYAHNNTSSILKSTALVADSKSSSSTAAPATNSINTDNNNIHTSQPTTSSSSGRRDVSLPHHVPKIESLSNKIDELRKTMGNEVIKMIA